MPSYYTDVEGNIKEGYVALAADINSIQQEIRLAISQVITDEFGSAFLLDSTENALQLTPATDLIDQSHEDGYAYKSLNQLYIIQKMNLVKSSVYTVKVRMKNEGGSDGSVSFMLKQPDMFEAKDGTIYTTKSVNVPAGANDEFTVEIGVDHLPAGEYELVVRGPDVHNPLEETDPDISIFYDDGSEGGETFGLYESADGYELEEINGELYYKEYYGPTITFDVQSAVAILRGEKVGTLDTHVSLNEGSYYGNRRDLICLTYDGVYEVIEGDVARRPVTPDYKVPDGYLVVAEAYVKKNSVDTSTITIEQDDTLGQYRLRSHHERLRRLEKLVNWINHYNSPERIKYNLSCEDLGDEARCTDANTKYYEDDTGCYWALSDVDTRVHTWDLKSDSGIDTGNSTCDHGNHTDGIAKLPIRSGESIEAVERLTHSNQNIVNKASYVYGNNAQISFYPAIWVYVDEPGYLNQIASDLRYYKNTERVWVDCYTEGMSFIERSDGFQVRGNTVRQEYGWSVVSQGTKMHSSDLRAYGTVNTFSGTKWLSAGWYVFVWCLDPANRANPAAVLANTWGDSGWPTNYRSQTYFGHYGGWYPMSAGGIYQSDKANGTIVTHAIKKSYNNFTSPGVLQSTGVAITVGGGHIESVKMDINMELPTDTTYKLEVSNNNGNTWHTMTKDIFRFASHGLIFKFRITLYTTNEKVSPKIFYDSTDGYAIKAELGLSEEAINNGCVVTKIFDGEKILQDAYNLRTDVDDVQKEDILQRFSRWEWIRVWAEGPRDEQEEEETGQKLWIDIETAEHLEDYDVNWFEGWKKVKSGLKLSELYHGSVDYSNYEGAYDNDEYNFHADTDIEIQQDRVLFDTFEETTGFPAQLYDVVTATSTPDNPRGNLEIAIDEDAQSGLLWYLPIPLGSLEGVHQIEFEYAYEDDYGDNTAYQTMSGALEIVISASPTCGFDPDVPTDPMILEVGEVGRNVDDDIPGKYTITLDDIENLGEAQSIGLRTRAGDITQPTLGFNMQFYLQNMYFLKTPEYPLIERYLRLRICMSRENSGDPSPRVRKVGVIPILS